MKNFLIALALLSLSFSSLAEDTSENLADRLSNLQKETGLSEEEFERALVRWCQQFEAMSELTPDHPLVQSGEFTVDDLREQYRFNQKLSEQIWEQFGQFERFHLIVLVMLNDGRTEEAKDLLRTHVASTYHRIQNSRTKNASGLVEGAEKEAKSDPKLKELISRTAEVKGSETPHPGAFR